MSFESVLKFRAMTQDIPSKHLTNGKESRSFLKTALAWKGSVTPKILGRLFWTGVYSVFVYGICLLCPDLSLDIAPFEYSGAVLGLILVARMNSGMSRWWEARKVWGSIINQSRNLAIIGYEYGNSKKVVLKEFLRWIAFWPFAMKSHLRDEGVKKEGLKLLGKKEFEGFSSSSHGPLFVGAKMASLLKKMREDGLDDFAFQRAERERALLIDAIGACERIKNTPIPLVLAIKTRRFILLFLGLLPFAIVTQMEWATPFVVILTAYPLFCLDEIGAQLQNPFAKENLSHLPLNDLCEKIKENVLSIEDMDIEMNK